MKKTAFLLCFFLTTCIGKTIAERAMYVDGFSAILGDVAAENALLTYAQSNQIETLLLYELHLIHNTYDITNPATNGVLAAFIYKAKTTYGILNIGATAENGNYFTNVIDVYNNSRVDPLEKFDIYNLEFEFWISGPTGSGGYYCTTYLTPNGLPCTNDGAFQFFVAALQSMRTLANNNSHNINTEAYVGWPTTAQANTISANLDRLRVHAYLADPSTAYNYAENRLMDLANGSPDLPVSIIFSSEPAFMQNWLENNSMLAAETIFTDDWTSGSAGWANNIDLAGFTYFTYTDMSNVVLPVELANFKGQLIGRDIILSWETLSEVYSHYFEIEKQHANSDKFQAIGHVDAAGNSASSSQYRLIDKAPHAGINYYRIKQVDQNGLFTYSNLIAVNYHHKFRDAIIYPTLVKDLLFVEAEEDIIQIAIYDSNGINVKTIEGFKQEDKFQIDVVGLIPGMYLLTLSFDTKLKTFRFIKQN